METRGSLTYDQCQYISKQYLQYLKGKITLEKINARLQKYFNTKKDFTGIIKQCKASNKGSSAITFEV